VDQARFNNSVPDIVRNPSDVRKVCRKHFIARTISLS